MLKEKFYQSCNCFAASWVMGIENQSLVPMTKLSTKQKREVYALSNLLLHVLVFVILLLSLNSCTEKDLSTVACSTPATVKDVRGLNGCGYVFVLDKEQKLKPIFITG